ncbi:MULTISPECIES: hypothetical protein [Mycobacteriaceae]|nr:hypothetical protein [Mycolicibacterium mucogenicum]
MDTHRTATVSAMVATATIAVITFGAATASAAPSGTGAQQTILSLQAQGNKVIIDKIGTGTGNQCSVASVSPVRTTPQPTANPLTGVPNLQKSTTVYVTLKC